MDQRLFALSYEPIYSDPYAAIRDALKVIRHPIMTEGVARERPDLDAGLRSGGYKAGVRLVMDPVGIVGLIAIIACSVATGPRGNDDNRRVPWLTLSIAALVAGCLVAQLLHPALLLSWRRDAEAIRSGESYRTLTALFVQDGWLIGGVFNLSMMIVVGRVAENAVGRMRWFVLYAGGGMLTELVAMRWQPSGAGNSIAYMSLAGALLTHAFLQAEPLWLRLASAAGLGVAAALCLREDIHGAAAGIGAVLALFVPARRRSTGLT